MLREEFFGSINLSKEAAIELLKEYGLEDDEILDDFIVTELKKKVEIKNRYKNKSSVSKIEIEGLFGKYNYALDFTESINIYVGENGHGKTTIIKIIVAVLKNDKKLII